DCAGCDERGNRGGRQKVADHDMLSMCSFLYMAAHPSEPVSEDRVCGHHILETLRRVIGSVFCCKQDYEKVKVLPPLLASGQGQRPRMHRPLKPVAVSERSQDQIEENSYAPCVQECRTAPQDYCATMALSIQSVFS